MTFYRENPLPSKICFPGLEVQVKYSEDWNRYITIIVGLLLHSRSAEEFSRLQFTFFLPLVYRIRFFVTGNVKF